MTRSRQKSPPSTPAAPKRLDETLQGIEPDPTERFERMEDQFAGAMIITVPPGADPSDLSVTQPLPKLHSDDFDEDFIRTREMPKPDADWLQEMLESGEQAKPRMPSKPGKDTTGLFPHPAAGSRTPQRSPSRVDISAAASQDEADARIRSAYAKYAVLCKKHGQPVVGEEEFVRRLIGRLDHLSKRYPRERIEFRPIVDGGAVRVRVLMRRGKR
jgi:hypothetical protein